MSLFDLIDSADQNDIQQRLNEVRLRQRSPAPWIFTARNRQGIAIVLETTAQVIR